MSPRIVIVLALGLVGALSVGSPLSAADAINIRTATFDDQGIAEVRLEISAGKDVQAFVMAFDWDNDNVVGVDLIPNDGAGDPLDGADLIVQRVEPSYMVFSVVMDVDGKDGEIIAAGEDIVVGTATFSCDCDDESCGAAITLRDKKYATVDGGPLLSNILVIEGLSIGEGDGLELDPGAVSCEAPPSELAFACGGSLDADGNPGTPSGPLEGEETVTFYYKSPGDGPGNTNKIQGLSMALQFHSDLTAKEDSFDIKGGALEEAGAEFVHIEVDNINKNDPCQIALGVLVDAVAPFDGRTLPSTNSYKKVFSIDFEIEDDAPCGECLPITFKDALSVNGEVDVYNLASINFIAKKPDLMSCKICAESSRNKFIRGDCNMSAEEGKAVNIADSATAVAYIFLDDKPSLVTCLDACDSNDDGRLDAADIVFTLHYLFIPYSKKPPAPGPKYPGVDPTPDDLDCEGGIESDC